jgi:hypothetical protein
MFRRLVKPSWPPKPEPKRWQSLPPGKEGFIPEAQGRRLGAILPRTWFSGQGIFRGGR